MLSISTRNTRFSALRWALLWAALTLPLACATAQQTDAELAPTEEAVAVPVAAPVKLDGETLFRVRGVSAYPAEQRAQFIANRITAVANDRAFNVRGIRVNETPFSTQIVAGNLVIVRLVDADAQLEQVRRQALAAAYLLRIQTAVEEYRHERQTNVLIRHTVQALAATAGLFLFWFVGLRILRAVLRVLERHYRHRIHEVGIQSLRLFRAEHMWLWLIKALKLTAAAVGALVSYATLSYIFSLFPWTRELSRNLSGFVFDPLRTMGSNFLGTIPDFIFLAILGVITYYLLKFIHLIFSSVETGAITINGFDPEWSKPTYRLIRGLVIGFALVVAFPYIPGSNTQAFKGVSLFIGLIFSLGSTSLIGNLVSGYSLAYRRAFKPGDVVKIGEYLGVVQESRLLVTYLHTIKNEMVAVPNSSIVNDAVVNYSSLVRTKGLILHTTVGIRYETPWRQVEAMLLEAAARTPGLLSEPKPFVHEKELRSFDIEYELNAYCDRPNSIRSLYAALHRNILDIFNEYGVQIMTPAYEGDPEEAKVVARDKWYSAPAVPNSSGRE